MSLLEQLRSARPLRKVGIQHDASGPNLTSLRQLIQSSTVRRTPADVLEISEKYDCNVLATNIENWSNFLALFTPRTLYVPLSKEHARVLTESYEDSEKKPDIASKAAQEYVASSKPVGFLIVQEDALLFTLGPGAEIQAKIDALGQDGSFMKLSSRSPKDAAARSGVFGAFYVKAIVGENGKMKAMDENEKFSILLQSEGAALRFKDATSAIRPLILSERVWQDMALSFRHPNEWNQNIVFRQWEPVPIDMEFRAFVCNSSMACILQYAYLFCSKWFNDDAQRHKQSSIFSLLCAL